METRIVMIWIVAWCQVMSRLIRWFLEESFSKWTCIQVGKHSFNTYPNSWCCWSKFFPTKNALYQVTNVDWQQPRTSQRALELAEEATSWVQRHSPSVTPLPSLLRGDFGPKLGGSLKPIRSHDAGINNRIVPAVTRFLFHDRLQRNHWEPRI